MVHGMHIYSWPITAKLAEVGWNKRRLPVGHNFGISRGNGLPSRSVKFAKGSRGISPGTFPEQINRQETRSFVDVVKEDRFWKPGNRGDHSDNILNLSWSATREDKVWNEQGPLLKRLLWIDVFGVPLDCWSKAFFKMLGGQVGEMLMVEEETVKKLRFDKGRILILSPFDKKIASEIQVRVGSRVVHIRMEESSDPISGDWLNKILGLNSKLAASLDSVREVSTGASEEGE
ncbi:hypothetical protein Q3G72_033649 [Acer saccharum]|nr:hypothetical protein Q3G72_033649 [Acer saccharum]